MSFFFFLTGRQQMRQLLIVNFTFLSSLGIAYNDDLNFLLVIYIIHFSMLFALQISMLRIHECQPSVFRYPDFSRGTIFYPHPII